MWIASTHTNLEVLRSNYGDIFILEAELVNMFITAVKWWYDIGVGRILLVSNSIWMAIKLSIF